MPLPLRVDLDDYRRTRGRISVGDFTALRKVAGSVTGWLRALKNGVDDWWHFMPLEDESEIAVFKINLLALERYLTTYLDGRRGARVSECRNSRWITLGVPIPYRPLLESLDKDNALTCYRISAKGDELEGTARVLLGDLIRL